MVPHTRPNTLIQNRTIENTRFNAVTQPDLAGLFGERLRERLVNSTRHQDPIHRNADLAHVGERPSRCRCSGLHGIGVVQDDEGALTAEFQRKALQV